MAITAVGMKNRYFASIAALTAQTSDTAVAVLAADAIIEALFAAVVDEIHANAHATGADSRGDDHALVIE